MHLLQMNQLIPPESKLLHLCCMLMKCKSQTSFVILVPFKRILNDTIKKKRIGSVTNWEFLSKITKINRNTSSLTNPSNISLSETSNKYLLYPFQA